MKTTILLIALGVASTTAFAQQSPVKAAGSAGSSATVNAEKATGKTTVIGNAETTVSSDAARKTAKKTKKVVQDTKVNAETAINETTHTAKNVAGNTNAAVSLQTASSINGSVNTDAGNNASVKNNNEVILKKEIKGATVVKAAQTLENTAAASVDKTGSKIKAAPADVKSVIKSNAGKISGKTASTVSTIKALQTAPVKAAIRTKTITGVKIR